MQPTDWETDIVLIVSYSTDAGAMISPLRFGMEGGMGALAPAGRKGGQRIFKCGKALRRILGGAN